MESPRCREMRQSRRSLELALGARRVKDLRLDQGHSLPDLLERPATALLSMRLHRAAKTNASSLPFLG
jgi:hypothetical protein